MRRNLKNIEGLFVLFSLLVCPALPSRESSDKFCFSNFTSSLHWATDVKF